MLVIAPRAWSTPPSAQALLLTSANAIPAISACDRTTKVFAVGDATAAKARAAGFDNVESAGRDANALTALVVARCDPAAGALLLASGATLGLELAADLRRRHFVVRRRIAYTAQPAAVLPADAERALVNQTVRYALFYSAASARAFAGCISGSPEWLVEIEALAISPPTARALSLLPFCRIRVASHPNQDELVGLLA